MIFLILSESKMSERQKIKRKAIGNKIKELRINAGHGSYESFANEHGFSRRNYWALEKGVSNFKINTLLKIMEIHKLTITEFFKDID